MLDDTNPSIMSRRRLNQKAWQNFFSFDFCTGINPQHTFFNRPKFEKTVRNEIPLENVFFSNPSKINAALSWMMDWCPLTKSSSKLIFHPVLGAETNILHSNNTLPSSWRFFQKSKWPTPSVTWCTLLPLDEYFHHSGVMT